MPPPLPHLSDSAYQAWYDERRRALSSSIDSSVEQLKEMQTANSTWPLRYPSPGLASRPKGSLNGDNGDEENDNDDDESDDDESDDDESDANDEKDGYPLPIAHELFVLRLDLRFGSIDHNEFMQKLGKDTIASVLEEKMSICARQLTTLRERINDQRSKILVTGDVNAGKSTFCNALLRRRILPEDQQPCTAIFCEVLHAKQNLGLEEVQAGTSNDTYDAFSLQDLERVVTDAQYTQCKVFVNDLRAGDESLLSNAEVVDITLIDAPGLNHDTAHTTAVFARQEEIDVVVFVVSATNHFTISAKDFIRAATAEKQYLFIVVNAFDTIANKERCKKNIMEQVRQLSPQTFEESSELVHFVSSNAVLPPSSNGQGNAGIRPSHEKERDGERVHHFERLEVSLRKFVLENRARSKLAPAKTYLLNVLHDIKTLAATTIQATKSELGRASRSTKDIMPQLRSRSKKVAEVGVEINTTIEKTCLEVLNHSRATIGSAIARVGDETENYDVVYSGPWTAFDYAEDLKQAMLSRISDVVLQCEDNARAHATKGVNAIAQLGVLHGAGTNAFERLQFRPVAMFSRRRDALARQVDISIELQDFIDWPLLGSTERFASAGMALTLATTVGGRLMDLREWLDPAFMLTRLLDNTNFRRLLIPGILITTVAAIAAHIFQQIPRAMPRHLASKIAAQLSAMDYAHSHSVRITETVRRVLQIPAEDVRSELGRSLRDLEQQREDLDKSCKNSQAALKYFGNLERVSTVEESKVQEIDLEGPPYADGYEC